MKEDNEIIAEFMGLKKSTGYVVGVGLCSSWYTDDREVHILYYDTSWDWLMPVVEKIEKTTTYVIEIWLSGGKGCRICYNNHGYVDNFNSESNSTIEAVYIAVVQFIKWYNTHGK